MAETDMTEINLLTPEERAATQRRIADEVSLKVEQARMRTSEGWNEPLISSQDFPQLMPEEVLDALQAALLKGAGDDGSATRRLVQPLPAEVQKPAPYGTQFTGYRVAISGAVHADVHRLEAEGRLLTVRSDIGTT